VGLFRSRIPNKKAPVATPLGRGTRQEAVPERVGRVACEPVIAAGSDGIGHVSLLRLVSGFVVVSASLPDDGAEADGASSRPG
jgi:hypothetical protein